MRGAPPRRRRIHPPVPRPRAAARRGPSSLARRRRTPRLRTRCLPRPDNPRSRGGAMRLPPRDRCPRPTPRALSPRGRSPRSLPGHRSRKARPPETHRRATMMPAPDHCHQTGQRPYPTLLPPAAAVRRQAQAPQPRPRRAGNVDAASRSQRIAHGVRSGDRFAKPAFLSCDPHAQEPRRSMSASHRRSPPARGFRDATPCSESGPRADVAPLREGQRRAERRHGRRPALVPQHGSRVRAAAARRRRASTAPTPR